MSGFVNHWELFGKFCSLDLGCKFQHYVNAVHSATNVETPKSGDPI